MLEECGINSEAVDALEIHEPPTVILTVAKALFSHHMSEQGIVTAYLGIQISRHDHNVTFRKSSLHCVCNYSLKTFSFIISEVSVGHRTVQL